MHATRSTLAALASPPERSGPRATLRFEDLEIRVRLGCGAEERRTPQEVRVAVTIRFDAPPGACRSDDLYDTVCYAELASALRARGAAREYRLIERLAADLLEVVRGLAPPSARLALEVHKVRPPVAALAGGVRFEIDEG